VSTVFMIYMQSVCKGPRVCCSGSRRLYFTWCMW